MAWLTFLSFIVINTVLLQNVVLSIVVDAFMDQKEAAAKESDLRDDLVMCCFATHCGVDYLGGDFRAGGCLACCCAKCRERKARRGAGTKHHFSRISRVVVDHSELADAHAARELHARVTLERAVTSGDASLSRGTYMSAELRARKARRKTWAAAHGGRPGKAASGSVLNSAATSIRLPKLATIYASGPPPTKQREVFDGYDIDGSGELCMAGELAPALKDLGLDPDGDFSEFDVNGSGTISFAECVSRARSSVSWFVSFFFSHLLTSLDPSRLTDTQSSCRAKSGTPFVRKRPRIHSWRRMRRTSSRTPGRARRMRHRRCCSVIAASAPRCASTSDAVSNSLSACCATSSLAAACTARCRISRRCCSRSTPTRCRWGKWIARFGGGELESGRAN
jgi:hypothetical protein